MTYYSQNQIKGRYIVKKLAILFLFFFFCVNSTYLHTAYGAENINTSISGQPTKRLSINKENSTVRELLNHIQKESGINFLFKDVEIDQLPKKSVKLEDVTLEEVLKEVFKNTGFTYTINGNSIAIKKTEQPQATQQNEKITIKGKVVDEDKTPIIGVTVLVQNSAIGAISDENGTFTFSATVGQVLDISCIGYTSQTVKITPNQSSIIITLEKKALVVDDVLVIGYGTVKKKDLTGSVTTFGENDIKRASATSSVQSMLQGRIAGVSTQISSASPTSPISVIIRGQSSLKGDNQPLWVIDGVPVYSSTNNGSVSNTLNNLDLSNVESVTILRDASATAIYGSRASNGVVIVTTKSGRRNQKPIVSFSSSIGFQKDSYNGIDYFESEEFINFTRENIKRDLVVQGRSISSHRKFLDENKFKELRTSEIDGDCYIELDNAFYGANTNWLKEVGQTPITQNYDISIRGGGANNSYNVSLFYKGYDGVIKTGFSDTFGGAINFDIDISNSLKFGVIVRGSTRKTNQRDDLMSTVRGIRPDYPTHNEDGGYYRNDFYTTNPLATLENTNQGNGNQIFIAPYLEWEIIKNLKIKTAPSIDYNESKLLNYDKKVEYEGGFEDNTRSWSNRENRTYLWDNTLTYQFNKGKHDLVSTVGFSMEKNDSQFYTMGASTFPDDDVLNSFSNASKLNSMRETYTANALLSLFARVQYKYSNAYLLTATIRRDGSSRFGADRRYGTFPSIGFGWIMSEEQFMKNVNQDKVGMLKARFAVGKTGSQNLGDYGHYSTTTGRTYNGLPATIPYTMANPELRWEESLMYDAGVDYSFFNNRLRGTFGWYKRNTSSLIYDMPTAYSSAYKMITANIAETMNTGIEFDVKYDVISKKDHLFTLDFNISNGLNKVIKFDGDMEQLYEYGGSMMTWNTYMRMKIGGKMNTWYGYEYLRKYYTSEEARGMEREDETGAKIPYNHKGNIMSSAGDVYLRDVNGDGKLTPENDYVELGCADPVVYGGFGLDYSWKNFNINANFTYAVGHKRYWKTTYSAFQTGNYNHIRKIANNSYGVKGESAIYPNMSPMDYPGNKEWNSLHLYDASYLKLNTLNVSYSFPERLFKNTIINSLSLSFQASNLFTMTRYPGMDPQGNWISTRVGVGMGVDEGLYPQSSIFTFGLKFSLK